MKYLVVSDFMSAETMAFFFGMLMESRGESFNYFLKTLKRCLKKLKIFRTKVYFTKNLARHCPLHLIKQHLNQHLKTKGNGSDLVITDSLYPGVLKFIRFN